MQGLPNEKRTVHIWDHPESTIQFLESVLGGQGWHAVIHHPSEKMTEGKPHLLTGIQQKFSGTSFDTNLGSDEHGNPTLTIRRFGTEKNLIESIGENGLGLTRGAAHVFENFGPSFGKLLSDVKKWIKDIKESPAQVVGGAYIIGDAQLAASGPFSKSGKEEANKAETSTGEKPKKKGLFGGPQEFLLTLSGIFAFLQSTIFMVFGKKGNKIALENLNREAGKAEQQGKAITEIDYTPVEDPLEKIPLLGPLVKRIKRDPITSGARAQQMGGMSAIASAVVRIIQANLDKSPGAEERKSSQIQAALGDMLAGMSTSTGWQMLTIEGTGRENPYKLPDPRWFVAQFKSHPETIGAIFNTAASVFGMFGASKKGNPMQLSANATYIGGDITSFLVENAAHGTKANDDDILAVGSANFLEKRPVIFHKSGLRQVIESQSAYLAKMVVDDQVRNKGLPQGEAEAKIAEKKASIAEALELELAFRRLKAAGFDKDFYKLIELKEFPDVDEKEAAANNQTSRASIKKKLLVVVAEAFAEDNLTPSSAREKLREVFSVFPDNAREDALSNLADMVSKASSQTRLDGVAEAIAGLASYYHPLAAEQVIRDAVKLTLTSGRVVSDETELLEVVSRVRAGKTLPDRQNSSAAEVYKAVERITDIIPDISGGSLGAFYQNSVAKHNAVKAVMKAEDDKRVGNLAGVSTPNIGLNGVQA